MRFSAALMRSATVIRLSLRIRRRHHDPLRLFQDLDFCSLPSNLHDHVADHQLGLKGRAILKFFAYFHAGTQKAAPVVSITRIQEFCAAVAGPLPPMVPSVGAAPPPSATSAMPHLMSLPKPSEI